MQFVGLTCLLGLTAMTMFQTYVLDRQIDTMKRQRGCASSVGDISGAHQSATEQAIRHAQGRRIAILSSIVAVFILLILGCRWIDSLAAWMTPTGVLRDTLTLGLLLVFGFVTSLPSRYYGWIDHAGAGAKPYLTSQARSLAVGIILGMPLLWGLFSVAHAAQGPWWLYLWCSLVVALVLEPVVFGRIIIPGISVLTPVGRSVNDHVAALMKQLGFKSAGVFEWTPAAWAGNVGILVLGFGSSRRVVIPTTLLRTLNMDEIAAVVAHDLGHGRAGHGPLQLIGRAVRLFVILGVFAWMTGQSRVLPGLDIAHEAQALPFLAALLLLDVVLKLLTLVERSVERHFEFRADSFVNGLLGPEALTGALLKLSADGSHSPAPDPLYSLINDRVPPAALRIARLQETAPMLMPVEQADEALPVIEQLAWIGRSGLLTFSGSDAVRDLAAAAERPSRPAGSEPKRKRQRRSPAAGPKRVRASLSMG